LIDFHPRQPYSCVRTGLRRSLNLSFLLFLLCSVLFSSLSTLVLCVSRHRCLTPSSHGFTSLRDVAARDRPIIAARNYLSIPRKERKLHLRIPGSTVIYHRRFGGHPSWLHKTASDIMISVHMHAIVSTRRTQNLVLGTNSYQLTTTRNQTTPPIQNSCRSPCSQKTLRALDIALDLVLNKAFHVTMCQCS
jgi:hypothetical protein